MSDELTQRSFEDKVRSTVSRGGFIKAAGALAGAASLFGATDAAGLNKAFAAGTCADTTTSILQAAVTAEQLATSFYYQGLAGPTAAQLGPVHNANNLNYFQAALWEEYQHLLIVSSVGGGNGLLNTATPSFYFPTGAFENPGTFLATLDALENAFIGAYLAAIKYWSSTSPNATLAVAAAQIMGVEAEHRALGRVTSGTNPPNNLIIENAVFGCVADAVTALLPFTHSGSGFSGPYAFPSVNQISAAASPYNNEPPLTYPSVA